MKAKKIMLLYKLIYKQNRRIAICRLLGVIANKEVDLEFSLLRADKPFKSFGQFNPDGWGIGWYERGVAKVEKEPISIKESQVFPRLSKFTVSKIIICHVRKSTTGRPSKENSHPFCYKNWIFAHNGSVNREDLYQLLKKEFQKSIKGQTDSEAYFYWIIQNIEEKGDPVEGIKAALNEVVNHRCTGLNFLLSDGQCLYSFRYANSNASYYTLYYLKRAPHGNSPFQYQSKELQALYLSKLLNQEKAVLVCSEKLTEENWKEIDLGFLIKVSPELEVSMHKII